LAWQDLTRRFPRNNLIYIQRRKKLQKRLPDASTDFPAITPTAGAGIPYLLTLAPHFAIVAMNNLSVLYSIIWNIEQNFPASAQLRFRSFSHFSGKRRGKANLQYLCLIFFFSDTISSIVV
jgi:hypothetical protein